MRKEREKVKEKLLSNFDYFVSPVRLCINNLPPSVHNEKLKEICLNAGLPNTRIIEVCYFVLNVNP